MVIERAFQYIATYLFCTVLVWIGSKRTYYALIGQTAKLDYGGFHVIIGYSYNTSDDPLLRVTWLVFGPIMIAWGAGMAVYIAYLTLF